MDIRIPKNELLKKIGLGVSIAGGKPSTLPILNNLLLETQKDGMLKIVATDMEVGVSTFTSCGNRATRKCYSAREKIS